MRPQLIVILAIIIMSEILAWWWMHPPLAGANAPVLAWSPKPIPADQAQTTAPDQTEKFAEAALIERPDIYAKSAPLLRCSGGKIFSQKRIDGSTVFMAIFEWNSSSTGSVLEAFRHMPEACMGSIGLKLIENAAPISYTVGDQTLIFDHTIFRDPSQTNTAMLGTDFANTGEIVHAFKAVWVSGLNSRNTRDGLFGNKENQLRSIRLLSALHRYRPAYARVVQGAVRGYTDSTQAWQAFEDTMLKDLQLEAPKAQ